jgi:16S rRNA (guanine527-N7)-methyltransferase
MTPAPDRAALEADLDRGLAGLALDADETQRRRLIDHLLLIERWNRVHNLTAVRDPAEMVTQHLLDSLAVVGPLGRHLTAPALQGRGVSYRLLDVGSGAGLPGAVLAIMQPALRVTCIDAVAKKAGFIRQVAGELAITNLSAEHARVEEWKAAPFDMVTSRAFASLSDFTALTRHLLSEGGVWLAMKGRVPDDEVAALPPTVEVFHVEPLRVPGLDAQRCIVWMRKRGQA